MKKNLLFLILVLLVSAGTLANKLTVGPGGPPTYQYATIQAAIVAAVPGDIILVAPGTYTESNILVDKSVIIKGTGASRNDVVIVPAGVDGNVDNAFGSSAQNGFIIQAHAVTIRNLTIDGNPALTPGVYNFRAGIVTLDPSQAGGGTWNNLHVDNVAIKYTWRRGISVFPRNVSGTVIENSSVEYVAYNQGMYLAGHSLVLNNMVKHCFQGIVQNPDLSTPNAMFQINGNTVTEIGNFPGCYNYPDGQPRAIQFDAVDSTFRLIEIKNNVINDNGSSGIIGTIGIYTRRANAASLVENNAITLSSGSSYSVGTQSVGLLLGWSYYRGFTARNNYVTTSGPGIGIMLLDVGVKGMPMILEGNVLTSTGSTHGDSGDGTGIYIPNEYIFYTTDKCASFVKIQNNNSITGFARGIEAEKFVSSTSDLTVIVHNNSIAGNTIGIEATTMTTPVEATNNWWGDASGPLHPVYNPTGLGNPVSNNVNFIPWWGDAGMTIAMPILTPGMTVLNTVTGLQYNDLNLALNAALNGETLYIAPGILNYLVIYNFPGKSVTIAGSGVPGQSIVLALIMMDGSLDVTDVTFDVNHPVFGSDAILITGGSLKLRHCQLIESLPDDQFCLNVQGGTLDAGTEDDYGYNTFVVQAPGSALNNNQAVELFAVGNNWGAPSGPYVATSNPGGLGGSIIGAGLDFVDYSLFANGPVTTIAEVYYCYGVTTIDIPVSARNFNDVGKLSLTFGFTPAQLTNPQLVNVNAKFSPWGAFTVTTDPLLLADGIFRVSGFGPLPADVVDLDEDEELFTLRFNIIPNQGTNSNARVFFSENVQGTACEYGGPAPSYHPFNDLPTSTYYLNGGVILNQLRKISGVVTYYNTANTLLTGSDYVLDLYASSDLTHSNLLAQVSPNGSGYYEFDDLCPDDTYDIVGSSSHDPDGSTNTTDAGQVNYWGVFIPYVIEKVRFTAGDVGTFSPYVPRDLNLNATDAQRIQQNFVNGAAFDRNWTFWRAGQFIASNPATESYPSVSVTTGGDVTANIYGLCTGDFNRSFNPLLKKGSSQTLELIYGRSMFVGANQEFDLPIRVVNPYNLGAVSLILSFPVDLVEVLNVTMNSTSGQLDWAVKGNELRIGWNSLSSATLGAFENLVILRLKTTEAFSKFGTIKLTLAPDPLNELADNRFDVIGDAILSVDVVEASPYGIGEQENGSVLSIHNYPNPFNNSTTITYHLPFSGRVAITVRNTFGEIAGVLADENQPAGDHTLQFDATGLAAGVYTATIELNSGSDTAKKTIKLLIRK